MIQFKYDPVADTAEEIRNGDPLRRAEIESRILANQPKGGIATTMNLEIASVGEYEARYFDVRHMRSDANRVWNEVIRWRPEDGFDTHDVARFWLKVAFCEGILFLQPLLALVSQEKLKSDGLLAYFERDVNLMPFMRLLVAQACCPLLRTQIGVDFAKMLATQPNWQRLLPSGESRTGFFARFVLLLRKEHQSNARRESRQMKSLERAGQF